VARRKTKTVKWELDSTIKGTITLKYEEWLDPTLVEEMVYEEAYKELRVIWKVED
jgi:hypothetical protein